MQFHYTDNFIIIVPFYNERSRFDIEYWKRCLDIPDVTWIFIDDGSDDGGHNLVQELIENRNCKLIRMQKSSGKATALWTGITYCINEPKFNPTGIGFLDFDPAFNTQEISQIIKLSTEKFREGYLSLYTSRLKIAGHQIERNYFRHFVGRTISQFLGLFVKNLPYDTQCGFKIYFVNDFIRDIFLQPPRTNWFFDFEMLIRYQSVGIESIVWEQPITYWRDVRDSKLGLKSILKVASDLCILTKIMLQNLK
jgi:glycosyltransferase involved in cell wall biosynthesis